MDLMYHSTLGDCHYNLSAGLFSVMSCLPCIQMHDPHIVTLVVLLSCLPGVQACGGPAACLLH